MSWSWSDTNFNKDFSTTARGLRKVYEMIPEDLDIPLNVELDRSPTNIKPLLSFRSFLQDGVEDTVYLNLDNYFDDDNDTGALDYSVEENSNAELAVVQFPARQEVQLLINKDLTGTSEFTYKAEDRNGWYALAKSVVMVGDSNQRLNNKAYFRPIIASSSSQSQYPEYANDGDSNSKWENQNTPGDTIMIDFESSLPHNFFAIEWGLLSTSYFKLEGSRDNQSWHILGEQPEEAQKVITFTSSEPDTIRYLRLVMISNYADSKLSVKEVKSDFIESNEAPIVIAEVPDYEVDLQNVKYVRNYVKFEDVFDDAEHPHYLEYSVESSNPALVEASKSLNEVGVNMSFQDGQSGVATISLSATDPFGEGVTTSYNVLVTDIISAIEKEEVYGSVYPNPAFDRVTIEVAESDNLLIELINLDAKVLKTKSLIGRKAIFDVNDLAPGVYLLRVTGSRKSSIHRIIKQ
jgi:hypothetical protein